MIHRVLVPQAFENMEEATVGRWLVCEGDAVARGDGLCDLITEKTTFTLESDFDGILRRCVIAEKSSVPVGIILALIGEVAEELPDADAENAAIFAAKKVALDENTPAITAPVSTQSAAPSSKLRATPAARRAAKERGVSLEDVAAQFPDKVLSESDVESYAAR